MSLFIEKPPEGIIGTSTALILSPDLREVLLAPHKLKTLMPLGGKVEEKDSWLFEECHPQISNLMILICIRSFSPALLHKNTIT